MALDGTDFNDDCAHLDTSNIELLGSGKEHLCKGSVHSSCPKDCELYVKEQTMGVLEK
ncbi:MAG: hypothetical protein PHG82_00325 [Candidatus Gracilibacteria bacterium]|nr:hypothetical protein [Candidatus Gracilibacteria bacterium]